MTLLTIVDMAFFIHRFSATNAVVFAQYFLILCGLPVTSYGQTATAIGVNTVACIGQRSFLER